jgi:hypothetical protein
LLVQIGGLLVRQLAVAMGGLRTLSRPLELAIGDIASALVGDVPPKLLDPLTGAVGPSRSGGPATPQLLGELARIHANAVTRTGLVRLLSPGQMVKDKVTPGR